MKVLRNIYHLNPTDNLEHHPGIETAFSITAFDESHETFILNAPYSGAIAQSFFHPQHLEVC
ncbi:hypothetical protein [Nostoc sp. NOS(2021)]|uniref:hypothetical protein n=1 Tax=Nostoc sp. NOS(2021) TaxID=2815407 RepID=UPI0025EDDD60|nr:hypothetical protein [Nostoc sp. NOS(2021)]